MAYTDTVNSKIIGLGGQLAGPAQEILDVSTTQLFPIGIKREYTDGRVFRYAKGNGTIAAGTLCSPDFSANSVVEVDNKATAAAIGATSVILTDASTLGSATADQYAGAYLHTTDDTGEGYQYKIKSNTAASSNAVSFAIYDPLKIAIDTSTDAAIVSDPSFEVVVSVAASDYGVVGVAPTAVVDGNFFWMQTKGVCICLQDGTIAAGDQVSLSDGVSGAVQVIGGGGTAAADILAEAAVGYALYAGDNTGHCGVMLNLGG